MAIKNVTIIGVGLIGGSLGISLKDLGLATKVVGVSRSQEHLNRAIEKQAIDEGTTDFVAAVREADLVILATPIESIIPILSKIAQHLKPGAIVTDVGSTKLQIVSEADVIMPNGCFFIGGHPMAGSEHSGIDAARAFLFDNSVWVFTPTLKSNIEALEKLKKFFNKLDIRPLVLKPEVHDKVVATISHLPYLVACSLVNVVNNERAFGKEMQMMAASGFRDTTRVASSDPEWGTNVCTTNKKALLETIGVFKEIIDNLEELIQQEDVAQLAKNFAKIKEFRDAMY